MAPLSTFGFLALAVRTILAQDDEQTCYSYGIDFQNGGSYFQNSNSNENFTFVSQYSGCADDLAYNILVDPNGDQTLCSDTMLRPDDTNMLSTCPIQKSQLFSGPWSVVILSDNGDDPSIAYERDFSLSVGPQLTSTVTPTVTATSVIIPIVTATSTVTDTSTFVLVPSTITQPSTTVTPTVFITPKRVTTTATKALLTLKFTTYTVDVTQSTKTKTASCTTPTRQARADPTASIIPTVGAMARTLSSKFRRQAEDAKLRFVEERRIRLEQRAPDPQPLTVTDTNTNDWPTITSTSTGPATTATIIATALTTTTSTPPAVTVLQGKTTAKAVTVTKPTPTRTVTKLTIATAVTTKTLHYVYTITTTTTPAAVSSACKTAGGILFF